MSLLSMVKRSASGPDRSLYREELRVIKAGRSLWVYRGTRRMLWLDLESYDILAFDLQTGAEVRAANEILKAYPFVDYIFIASKPTHLLSTVGEVHTSATYGERKPEWRTLEKK